jgi:hypothetical protein
MTLLKELFNTKEITEAKSKHDDITTTDMGEFGRREIRMASELLNAWVKDGLPDDFENEGVHLMMNKHSGHVFLTNEEYQVAMESEGKLYMFYTSPYNGVEGSWEDLEDEYKHMHEEDKEWFRDLPESKKNKFKPKDEE